MVSKQIAQKINALKLDYANVVESTAYLDRASSDMAIVGQTCREGWPVIEGELWFALRELQLFVEGIDLFPVGKHFLLLCGEVRLVRHYTRQNRWVSIC